MAEKSVEENQAAYRFKPPVYIQRYTKASDVLEDARWRRKIQKVVEFGCAELRFFSYFKNLRGITSVLEVDIDRAILDRYRSQVVPVFYHYMIERSEPLGVVVLEGSVAEPDYRLIGCDAVVCIELIEHLEEDVLEKFPKTVFEYTEPWLAIVTTPNKDFNEFFPNLADGGFRHPDHKFEWTRKEFQDWAHNIVTKYSNYKVEFHDIGIPKTGDFEHLGGCSQMAVFIHQNYVKKDDIVIPEEAESAHIPKDINPDCVEHYLEKLNLSLQNKPDETNLPKPYKKVIDFHYPYHVDKRTREQKLVDEAQYRLNLYAVEHSEMWNEEEKCWEIPVQYLIKPMAQDDYEVEPDELRDIMIAKGYTIKNDIVSNYKVEEEEEEVDDYYCEVIEPDPNAEYTGVTHPIEEGWDLESR